MNITGLTSNYDIYYNGEKLNTILNMDYEVVTSTIGGHRYVEIDITYIGRNGILKHITTLSDKVEFKKKEGNKNEYKN